MYRSGFLKRKRKSELKFTPKILRTTLRRKSIGPFADFSYKMAIFKRLEKYLKVTQNSSLVHQLLILMGDLLNEFWCENFQRFGKYQLLKLHLVSFISNVYKQRLFEPVEFLKKISNNQLISKIY